MPTQTARSPQPPTPDSSLLPIYLAQHLNRIVLIVTSRMSARLRTMHSAEDVVQEVVVRMLRQFRSFEYRGEASFVSWIATVAKGVLIDRERSAKLRGGVQRLGDGSTWTTHRDSQVAGNERTPSSIVSATEHLRQIRQALQALDDEERMLICRVYFEGPRLTEYAAEIGCHPQTASSRLSRAVAHVSELLAEAEP